jgi:hypothetical protein
MSKKNDISAERVVIDAVDVEPLLRNERWSASGGENEPLTSGAYGQNNAFERGENSVVEELCLRPQIIGKDIDIERLVRLTSEDIIDKFLSTEHHRIVAEEGEPESEIVVQAEFDDEDDFCCEKQKDKLAIFEDEVKGFDIGEYDMVVFLEYTGNVYITDFDKTVFLTKEDAEAKLKEIEGK